MIHGDNGGTSTGSAERCDELPNARSDRTANRTSVLSIRERVVRIGKKTAALGHRLAYVRPRGIAVYIRAEHFCMQAQGVRELSSQTGTLVMRGAYNKNPLLRDEFRLMIDRHAVPGTLAAILRGRIRYQIRD